MSRGRPQASQELGPAPPEADEDEDSSGSDSDADDGDDSDGASSRCSAASAVAEPPQATAGPFRRLGAAITAR